ncbi:hypothetical protein NBRC10512_004663 [Rhodotorula toruloides]|uniref:RHTO0S09e01574g1_1 n=2 Tax=Rhodotorula toruloides TaxID=5286 RepID=A0A061B351_RHOTO|nr:short-chain dehydrogenase/reductase SDR family protein [Rhodotorula toruloides NP11]EMS22990.1 short-chain dehydrogenase/reductase SDR family protein [Rhodotorula toruloides NP11]CDR44243.1 RHTO0S09e01574g1_1 [Rhodotorula toruloides]
MLTILSDITGIGAEKRTPYDPPQELPPGSLEGKVYLVTGGHGGIGLETTRFLALAGARILIASRSSSKVHSAIDSLSSTHGDSIRSKLEYVELDLASLASVKRCAERVLEGEQRLDGVVCNAGIMALPYKLTEDGVEQQFQVNVLGHWLLVNKLLPLLEKTHQLTGEISRVVVLSSFAHNFISLYPFSSPSLSSASALRKTHHSPWLRYSVSKLAGIWFARELDRRGKEKGVRSLSVHPGFVSSNLYDTHALARPLLRFFIPPSSGSYTTLFALTSPQIAERDWWGEYLVPFGKRKEPRRGKDTEREEECWRVCEAVCRERVGGV